MPPLDPLAPPKLEQRLARPAHRRPAGADDEQKSLRTKRMFTGLILLPIAIVCCTAVDSRRLTGRMDSKTDEAVNGKGLRKQSRRARRDSVLDDNLADLPEPLQPKEGPATNMPIFWHVPKSGGTTIKDLYYGCYKLTLASEVGAQEGHGEDKDLRLVKFDQGQHVNVDTTTPEGIDRASRLKLAEAGMADVLVTPLLHDVAEKVLSKHHRGRMFALFRHPVDRIVSQFYYLQHATHEPTYDARLANMTFYQYAASGLVESNWMVRSLTNKMEGPLTADDLEEAKRTLRTKCLVGLLDELETSLARFRHFFGWDHNYDPQAQQCQEHLLARGGSNKGDHPLMTDRSGRGFESIARKNVLDLILYEYARELFTEQGALLSQLASGRISPAEVSRKLYEE